MYQVIYASRASSSFKHEDLKHILEVSRHNNTERNITGILLFRNNQFLQVLEGNQSDVEYVYKKIKQDHRHNYILTYMLRNTDQRIFEDWSMAFENLDDQDISHLEGYNPIFDKDLASEEVQRAPQLAQVFVKSFVNRTG